jgi:hypothetical protein
VRLTLEKIEQHLRAEFFFAFDQETKIDRRPAGRLDRLQQAEHLSLVVGRAARVQPAIADRRLERRRGPLVERIGRLDVVMTVDEQRRRPRHVGPRAPDDGMRLAAEEFDVPASEPPQLGGHPLRGGAAVGIVSGQRRNGRNAEELTQLTQQSFAIHDGENVE